MIKTAIESSGVKGDEKTPRLRRLALTKPTGSSVAYPQHSTISLVLNFVLIPLSQEPKLISKNTYTKGDSHPKVDT